MKTFLANLKKTAMEHPVETIAVVALAVTATAKLITAVGNYEGSHAYAKDVQRRLNASK